MQPHNFFKVIMQKDLINKIRGVIFGQAVGDALGLGAEFLTKTQVSQFYSEGLTEYEQIIEDGHRSRWEKGEWTDDTDQMLCIFNSILDKKNVDIKDIAKNLYNWAGNGGRGIGNTIYAVLSAEDFLKDPHKVSLAVWEKSGKMLAANGGIMRTSVLGVWEYYDLEKVKENAENVCKITHYDPRCIGSCVALTTAIALLLQGETNFDTIFRKVSATAIPYDERIREYLDLANTAKKVEELDLNQKDAIGYTLKALAVGFWALKNTNFEDGVVKIINEGGDADTNAAVAAALLGAKYGYDAIPTKWSEKLKGRDVLEAKTQQLIKLITNIEDATTSTQKINKEKQETKENFWQKLMNKMKF
jgi:ADP-ribosylglycohydrolase